MSLNPRSTINTINTQLICLLLTESFEYYNSMALMHGPEVQGSERPNFFP